MLTLGSSNGILNKEFREERIYLCKFLILLRIIAKKGCNQV